MQKQSGNGIKGKEAKVAKERRLGSQLRKSMLKGNRQNNSKGATKFIEIYRFLKAGSNCSAPLSMPDLKPALFLLLLSKLMDP